MSLDFSPLRDGIPVTAWSTPSFIFSILIPQQGPQEDLSIAG
jgi:hypothetical protein